jgi:type 1 glutamine amidotransferase
LEPLNFPHLRAVNKADSLNFENMKSPHVLLRSIAALALVIGCALSASAAPKKILVVTVTTGFRHDSIPTAERILAQLATESGAFTVDYVRQPDVKIPGKPGVPQKPKDLKPDATDAAKEKYGADMKKFEAAEAKYKLDLAKYEADAPRIKALQQDAEAQLKHNLSQLSPDNLKNYDGVIFANTTGDLPLPDKQGFIDWVKAGHAFMAMHSGSDTFHEFRPYIEMLGGEFQTHGAQEKVECLVQDSAHPATRHFGKSWNINDKKEEMYIIKSYDKTQVHELLTLDKHPNSKEPGHYAVSWCKQFGTGKVFYTSLGHNQYVWDMPEYQKHILGGIKWALGLEPGDATPQAR